MLNKFFHLICGFCLFLAVLSSSTQVAHAQTQAWDEPGSVCVAYGDVATIQGFQCLVGNLLSISITGIGFSGFIMMIIGSFRYMLSGGNAKGIDDGKKSITYAIIGMVLALCAFMGVKLVSDFTGIKSILRFEIPTSDKNWGAELGIK